MPVTPRVAYLDRELDSMFQAWLGRASLWGSVLFLSFAALDHVVAPEHFAEFLSYRLFTTGTLLAVGLAVLVSNRPALHSALACVAVLTSAATIEMMILRTGGHASTYFVGMILLATCVIGLIPTRLRLNLVFALSIYLVYLIPIVATDKIEDGRFFFMANFFTIAIIVTTLVMRYITTSQVLNGINTRYDLIQTNIELSISERRFRSLIDSTDDSIYLVDPECRYLLVNPKHLSRLGVSREECIGRHFGELHDEEESRLFRDVVTRVVASGEPARQEVRSAADGRYYLRTLSPVIGDHGRIDSVIVVSANITDQKAAEEEFKNLSLTDPLTGLYNRRGVMAIGEHRLRRAAEVGERLFVIFADLDGLKQTNDLRGHPAGDRMLVAAGAFLRSQFPHAPAVGRIGGDEFVVVHIGGPGDDATSILDSVLDAMDAARAAGDGRADFSLTAGVAAFDPASPCAFEELVARADARMYEAKRRRARAA